MRHTIEATRENLHGAYHPDLEPILEVEPGDIICSNTVDVGWGTGQHDREAGSRPKIEPRSDPKDDGPAMVGPIYVDGASVGDTLSITLDALVPETWGWTWWGDGLFNRELNESLGVDTNEPGELLLWEVDRQANQALSEHGDRVELFPFLGTLGLCPGGSQWHSGWFPSVQGGNVDCKRWVQGTTVYLPVAVEGGLLSFGDAHAAQGHGEVAGSAIEICMERVEMTVDLAESPSVEVPTARTPTGWVTLGTDQSLDRAIAAAMRGMLDVMRQIFGLEPARAMLLASTMVDLEITQLVNRVRGVHAFLPHEKAEGIARGDY